VVEAPHIKAAQSDQLVARASEAYRVTTTIGLAASFDQRANRLNKSVYLWMAGLALSLLVLLIVGAIRLTAMKDPQRTVIRMGKSLGATDTIRAEYRGSGVVRMDVRTARYRASWLAYSSKVQAEDRLPQSSLSLR